MTNNLLLHACCAPCGAYSGKFLENEGYNVTFYFFNPNIYPIEEHDRRLNELKRYCEKENYKLIIELPNFSQWDNLTEKYPNELEKGKRCFLCYKMRLEKTAIFAKENNFDCFTTTLSISPHKSYEMISQISKELSETYGIKYLDVNLKKKDGYRKSVELSRVFGFYRQDYCGCKYSIRTS